MRTPTVDNALYVADSNSGVATPFAVGDSRLTVITHIVSMSTSMSSTIFEQEEVSTTTAEPVTSSERTDSGHIALDTGSKSYSDFLVDTGQENVKANFPVQTTARTTLYARDAENEDDITKYSVLFRLQHGRQHPAESALKYYESWEGHKIRQEEVYEYRRAETILSQADITGHARASAVDDVMRENLNGFNRHYQGIDGAALGFAALHLHESLDEAKDSHLSEVTETKFGINSAGLFEYVWGKYGK